MSDSEAIERLKAIHRRKHIARVADDTPDARKPSRVWSDNIGCGWCGKPFNQTDEGTLRDYCSIECKHANERASAKKKYDADKKKAREYARAKRARRAKKGAAK
jgi:endogenous inhibitor of DNA gyrase (YacG/DUF329 family)